MKIVYLSFRLFSREIFWVLNGSINFRWLLDVLIDYYDRGGFLLWVVLYKICFIKLLGLIMVLF